MTPSYDCLTEVWSNCVVLLLLSEALARCTHLGSCVFWPCYLLYYVCETMNTLLVCLWSYYVVSYHIFHTVAHYTRFWNENR